jgi:glyoxylase-like metal-dependent hydrolase (beta-lactamase superfamily II)
MFDTVYLVRDSYDNFKAEQRGRGGLRERKASNAPFVALSKIVSNYEPPQLGHCAVIGERTGDDPLEFVGSIRFGNWMFEVYEGAGGHVAGETVIACPELGIVFTGDLIVNHEGMTPEQLEYEQLQPYLLTSYDANPALADACRELLEEKYDGFTVLPGRGPVMWA